jgi:RHS repeat-associated protein
LIVELTTTDGSVLTYTHNGGLATGMTWTGAVCGRVSQALDDDGRVTSQAVNGERVSDYCWDADGSLRSAGGLIVNRGDGSGWPTATRLGHVTTTHRRNDFGEVEDERAAFDGKEILAIHYARDLLGRITRKVETIEGGVTIYTYEYDPADRLADARVDGALVAHYEYDPSGNRLACHRPGGLTHAAYDDQDQLLQSGAAAYCHTANGERSSRTIEGHTDTFEYDAFGNLRSVSLANGTRVEYLVDGQHRRIGKKVNGALVQAFLYQDQLCPVAELDGENRVVSRFIYATGVNVPDYMERGGRIYRLLTDHLGSPRLVIDVADGTVVQRLDYDEFGVVLRDTNPGFQPFGFAGGLYDRHTAFTHFGFRDYDAQAGRWTTRDPIGMAGGWNLYEYVDNDPINSRDPLGLYEYTMRWKLGKATPDLTPERAMGVMQLMPYRVFPFIVEPMGHPLPGIVLGKKYNLKYARAMPLINQ